MNLTSIIKGMLNIQKKIDIQKLPSQGLFYKKDFELFIKKANIEDIIEYEYLYNKEDIGIVITRLKKIVEKNTILLNNYTYNDIKSIDVVYLFIEIVKFTNNKPISLTYFNNIIGKDEIINFESDTFNYMTINNDIMEKYDPKLCEIDFDGYKYSIPCIGLENALTQFLISKSENPGSEIYNSYSYDFIYFMGHKSHITFNEIDNLIQIFNFDISENDQKKIRKIVKTLSPIGKYSLKKGDQVIDVTAKIDLSTIWK